MKKSRKVPLRKLLDSVGSGKIHYVDQFKFTEAVVQRCSVKKVFLEIPQNSKETPVPESRF